MMNKIDQRKIRHYLDYCFKISQDYKDWRRIYLEINIGFTSFFSLALSFIVNVFILNEIAKLILYLGFIFLLVITSYNIYYNLREHKTENTVKTWYHYRHHFYIINREMKEKGKEIECDDFANYSKQLGIKEKIKLKNDWRALFNLYKFQEHYFKLLKKTRIITLWSLLVFFIAFILSFLFFIGTNIYNYFSI